MKPIRVLSIDGGGMRGIVAARVLTEIETIAKQPVFKLFDVIVGTSIGGIAAMALTLPRDDGVPGTAAEIGDFYTTHGPLIFPQATLAFPRTREELRELVARVGMQAAMFGSNPEAGNARYSPGALEEALLEQFGDARLSDAIKPVIVTAYDVTLGQPALFSSTDDDHLMRDIARATSAAPTVFPPKRLLAVDGTEHIFIDGGVFANNPAMVGYAEAMELAGWHGFRLQSIQLVSVGTGIPRTQAVDYEQFRSESWLHLAQDMFEAGSRGRSFLDDALLRNLLGDHYHRFEPILPADIALDDASKEIIVALHHIADDYVETLGSRMADLVEVLVR